MESLVSRDHQAHQEKLDHPDHLAREDPRELLEQRAGKERRALRVKPALRVQQVKLDQSDLKDLQESPDLRVYEESPALWENKDCPEPQDRTVHLVPWVLLVSPV